MRHREAKVGRGVKAREDFKLIGDMSFPKKVNGGKLIARGTKGTVNGAPIKVRDRSYIPVIIGGRKADVLAKYLELA